jgi:hypothetical protein
MWTLFHMEKNKLKISLTCVDETYIIDNMLKSKFDKWCLFYMCVLNWNILENP